MAHLIDFSNNRANIAYQGVTPWHGLGQKVDKDSSLEVWAEAGGFNFQCLKTPALYSANGQLLESDHVMTYRSDTLAPLGVVTDRYKPAQPSEILEFYRDLVALEGWHIETVGCLDGGKRIWALAKTGDSINVLGTVDKIDTYLLLSTSFDGKSSTVGTFTSVRVVCNNTLTLSLGESKAKVSMSHSTAFNPVKMKRELGIHLNATEQLKTEAEILAKRKVSNSESVKFLCRLLAGQDTTEGLSTRQGNIIKGVFDLYQYKGKGCSLPTSEGTSWGLLNAVTEYVDHHHGNSRNNSLRNAWFGQGENLKLKAKQTLLELAA